MVSWLAPGAVGGVIRTKWAGGGASDPWLLLFDPKAYSLASPGTVDLNGATRNQYAIAGVTTFPASGSFSYDSADVDEALFSPMGAAAFLVRADTMIIDPEVVPTPTQIRNAAGALYVGGTGVGGSASTLTATTGTLNLEFEFPAAAVDPNKKYWIAVIPSYFNTYPPTSKAQITSLGDANINGRALSLWTNRSPGTPVITSPTENVIFSGATTPVVFGSGDPDRVTSFPTDWFRSSFADIAGVHIQYAPASVTDPLDPLWDDLPIVSTDGSKLGRGWHIVAANPEAGFAIGEDGAENFWANREISIQCGGSFIPMAGYLPVGEWQVRIRTFDYGHSRSTGDIADPDIPTPPLNDATGNYTPDTYPAVNTSPWSESVFIASAPQVLKPLAISPRDNAAVVEGAATTLTWRYRNTYSPPFPQKYRTVQIRRVGDAEWTTLTGDNDWDLLADNPDFTTDGDGWTERPFESSWTWSAGALENAVGNGLRRSDADVPARPFGTSAYRIRTTFTNTVPVQSILEYSFGTWQGAASKGAFWEPATAVDSPVRVSEVYAPGTHTHEEVWVASETDPDGTYVWVSPRAAWSGGASTISVDSVHFEAAAETTDTSYLVTGFDLVSGNQYEWRVMVTDADDESSEWSDPARFWVIPVPASGAVIPSPEELIEGATLGCGTHRVFVYRRGGRERVGEITDISSLDWNRVRDDISTAKINVSGWGIDCGNLLSELQTWAYEVVIFRDNGFGAERVWEGPITLLTYERDKVVIHAKDVMVYSYRRIIKQALSDFGNSPTAGASVTNRAMRVLQNAFAPDDPNVLAYLQDLEQPDDAKQYRSTPAYGRTAFEEVDDMAANAGLDYTVVGRAILLWGTKHRIGTLPEFRDKDLGSSPIVSEYGMSMSNSYAISDGNGVYGEATRLDENDEDPVYGLVEMLSSTWASESADETGTYTEAGLATLRQSFADASERSISDRYPPPVVVRVPDNTRLNPDTVLSIQHLVPGVVVPLRSTGTLRTVVATQKLDAIKVVEAEGQESITITLSPFSRDDVEVEEGE